VFPSCVESTVLEFVTCIQSARISTLCYLIFPTRSVNIKQPTDTTSMSSARHTKCHKNDNTTNGNMKALKETLNSEESVEEIKLHVIGDHIIQQLKNTRYVGERNENITIK